MHISVVKMQKGLMEVLFMTLLLSGCAGQQNVVATSETPFMAVTETATDSLATKTYVNSKIGFTLTYPRALDRKKEFQDGDGMYFMDEKATLLIWGSTHDTVTKTRSSLPITVNSGSYTISSYQQDGQRYLVGTITTSNATIQIELNYPLDQKNVYQAMETLLVNEISKSQ